MVLRCCPSCASLSLLLLCLSSHTWVGSSSNLNDCKRPLGLQDGRISNSQLSSPNHYKRLYIGGGESADMNPGCARLNNMLAWCSPANKYSDMPVYIEIDLKESMDISEIATQGFRAAANAYYVTQYNVSYSNDRVTWKLYKEVLAGNTDAEAAVTNTFNPKISARYIRVYPVKYRHKVCMRLELYGLKNCSAESIPQPQEDPTQTVTTPTTAAPEHQTTIAKNTTLRKETTRPKEIDPVDAVTPTPIGLSAKTLNVAPSREEGKNTPFTPTAGVPRSVSPSQVSSVASQDVGSPSDPKSLKRSGHLVVAVSVTAAVIFIFMVPVTIFAIFLYQRKQSSCDKFPSANDTSIPLTTAVVDEDLYNQEFKLMYGVPPRKHSLEEMKFHNKCAV